MASFREISRHFPALVIDAASSLIQVGWLEGPTTAKWTNSTDEAGIAVFECLARSGFDPDQAGAFVYCEGPGSVLGIRTVAMALRTWTLLRPRPVFAYRSLALLAHGLNRTALGVIADARRDSWHHYRLGGDLRRLATTELVGELAMPENFRHWSPLPPAVARVPYNIGELIPRTWDAPLLQATDAPDAFLHEEPSYVTWTPQIHRAPSPP